MPRFKPGEIAVLLPNDCPLEPELEKYNGEDVICIQFVGMCPCYPKNKHENWWKVKACADGFEFFADESALKKKPPKNWAKELEEKLLKSKPLFIPETEPLNV